MFIRLFWFFFAFNLQAIEFGVYVIRIQICKASLEILIHGIDDLRDPYDEFAFQRARGKDTREICSFHNQLFFVIVVEAVANHYSTNRQTSRTRVQYELRNTI